MFSVYQRRKNDAGAWRYQRIETGRGVKTGDLQPPFFTRMTRNGKQGWPQLQATTFKEAQAEIDRLEAGIEAQGQGLTVAELANPDRLTVAKAVAKFVDHAEKSKKKKTVNGYRLNLKQFQEATSVIFLDQVTR